MINFEPLARFRDNSYKINSLISEWAKAYEVPLEAVEKQVYVAHAWCNSNPKKAPKKDPVRFLNNWMRIAKSMGSLVSKPVDTVYKPIKVNEDEIMTGDDFKRMKEEILKAKLMKRS